MPQIKLTFASETEIPAELKAFKAADNTVTIWAGDKVAEETNPGLAQNRDTILTEKTNVETKYNALLASSSTTDQEKARILAENQTLKNQSAAPEDLEIVRTIKSIDPNFKAADVKTKLTNYAVLETELTSLKNEKTNQSFFKLSGFKNEKVFLKTLADKEVNPNLVKTYTQSVTEGGKTIEKLYAEVKESDGTTKQLAFNDYVKSNASWNDWMPSLNNGDGATQDGKPWISQTSTGVPPVSSDGKPTIAISAVIDKQNKDAAAKPNPLFAPPTPTPGIVPQT